MAGLSVHHVSGTVISNYIIQVDKARKDFLLRDIVICHSQSFDFEYDTWVLVLLLPTLQHNGICIIDGSGIAVIGD